VTRKPDWPNGHTNYNESNAEWSSKGTPANYFSAYLYATHLFWAYSYAGPFNFGHFVPIFWHIIRQLTDALPIGRYWSLCLTISKTPSCLLRDDGYKTSASHVYSEAVAGFTNGWLNLPGWLGTYQDGLLITDGHPLNNITNQR